MRIALISYECPPDTADGGVATYVGQAALMLAKCGHEVEVFAGSRVRTETSHEDAITVHRINAAHGEAFRACVAPLFAERHAIAPFDVLEAPEWGADAASAIQLVPNIPLVIKLHSPSYLLLKINEPNLSSLDKIRKYTMKGRAYVGAVRRGKLPYWHREKDVEYKQILTADEIAAPSKAIGIEVARYWSLDRSLFSHVPYPYVPSETMLDIPIETETNTVTFLGRLEVRKGVLDLARAIPLVLRKNPQAKFRFVGRPSQSPDKELDMRQYLERLLKPHQSSVEFLEAVPLDAIPSILCQTDICVFPSIWENFPNVCLEAMAAGRGVIGSSAGGMLDMLEDGKYGLNVMPRRAFALSEAINSLLADTVRRQALGRASRGKVLSAYNMDRISALQEESYARAISRRNALGPRKSKTA